MSPVDGKRLASQFARGRARQADPIKRSYPLLVERPRRNFNSRDAR